MDSLHGPSTAMLLASAAAAAAWMVKGLLGETRDRLGRRLADWLVPLGHPVTYRLARLTLALAALIAPRNRASLIIRRAPVYAWRPEKPLLPGFNPKLIFGRLNWGDLEAAAAELEVDRQRSAPIAKPVRLVAPLLLRALGIRLANLAVRAAFLAAAWIARPTAQAAVFLFRLMRRALTAPFDLTMRRYEGFDRRAAEVLLRSGTRQLPPDTRQEERSFWRRAMNCRSMGRRRSWTTQIALDVWIRRRQRIAMDGSDGRARRRDQRRFRRAAR